MADVAQAAGFHQTTVSLALRNDPRLPIATRERIQQLAEKMGYRPHPLVSALIALRRSRRPPRFRASLAFVVREGPRGHACVQQLAGAQAAAEKMGYKVDEFVLGETGLTEYRLDAVLLARNIHGVLIAPLPEASGLFTLNWNRLCTVALEYTFSGPAFDRVVHDSYGGMRRVMDECRRRGIRRVGLLLSTTGHERTERLNGAAYWIEQKSGNFFPSVPPLFMPTWNADLFTAWYRRHRLEVVVTSNDFLRDVEAWAGSRQGRGADLQLINVNAMLGSRQTGVFQDPFNIGAVAARMLIEKISRNESGIPAQRQTMLTPGQWVEGRPLRPLP